MKETFTPAPEVDEIGRELIEEYHQHLLDHSVRVEFLFRSKVPRSKGREVWGTARKVSGLNAHLRFLASAKSTMLMDSRRELDYNDEEKFNEPFFLIVVSRPIWQNLKDPQKRALVNHELMHCESDIGSEGEVKLSIVGHDFEAFYREFELHGLWRRDAEKMLKTLKNAQQLKLELTDDATSATSSESSHRRVREKPTARPPLTEVPRTDARNEAREARTETRSGVPTVLH